MANRQSDDEYGNEEEEEEEQLRGGGGGEAGRPPAAPQALPPPPPPPAPRPQRRDRPSGPVLFRARVGRVEAEIRQTRDLRWRNFRTTEHLYHVQFTTPPERDHEIARDSPLLLQVYSLIHEVSF